MPSSAKLVLIYLADRANPKNDNKCWPAVGTVARETGLSERTVQSKIKFLELTGQITVEERRGRSSKYHLHPRKRCTSENATPVKAAGVASENREHRPRSDCTQTVRKGKKKPLQNFSKFVAFPPSQMRIYGLRQTDPVGISESCIDASLSDATLNKMVDEKAEAQHSSPCTETPSDQPNAYDEPE